MANLGVVTAQSCHLDLKGLSNVAEVVRLFSPPQEDFFDLVGHNPLFHQVGIGQAVAGIGEDGVQHNPTSNAVVAVPDIASVWVAGNYDFWPVYP